MFRPNDNFHILPKSYLFSEVADRLRKFREANPDKEVIRMDIGDVSLPLPESVLSEMRTAVDEMGDPSTFHGYGPEQGYMFLREKIAEYDYKNHGISIIKPQDIFISDGAKSDLGNIGNLFGKDIKIGVCDPGYPVYVDANVMDGRGGELKDGRWSNLIYIECKPENDFIPEVPKEEIDVIYLCSPCNPTGVAFTKEELQKWVDYALEHGSLIIYDSAYEAYVSDENTARSIYEASGAEKCAIEIRSFSKTAGFTGVRCGYTVVPEELKFTFSDGEECSLRDMWNRRQCTKFNGTGYIVQRGAEALYTPEGRKEIKRNIGIYMNNARKLRNALLEKGYEVIGGENSPYVWFKAKDLTDSWEAFDKLMRECLISSTPGVGFGKCGQGWLRVTGFNTPENTDKAIKRIKNI